MTPLASRRARRIARTTVRTVVGAFGVAMAWLGLALHPEPLFAHSAERANIVLHSRKPLPPEASPLLEEVVRRVSRSPLYDPAQRQHVFLCDTPALFGLLTLKIHAGGVTQMLFGRNVFIRPSSIERDAVFGPSGVVKESERSLTYFVAHELTHAMTADRLGGLRARRLAAFQREGYADRIGFDHAVDFRAGREAILRDAPEMSVQRSGLYRRYELLTAYLLERRGMTVQDFFARPLTESAVQAQFLADPNL
jgi:hypothetical protein